MNRDPVPLLDLFWQLRQRNFQLGVSEYLLALQALAQGFGTGSREALTFVCQTLWAKSPEEQAVVADLLAALLPEKLSQDDLDALLSDAEQEDTPARLEEPPRSAPSPPPASPAREHPPSRKEPPASTFTPSDQGLRLIRREGADSAEARLAAPQIPFLQFNPHLDFKGTLPITRRQMKRAWRYYRRMQRSGPRTELDVTATIEQMYRDGVLARPVLVPRRCNQARMLMLVDEGGSMLPFRCVVQALVDSARHSGLAHVATFYFHDAPGRELYRNARLTLPAHIDEVLSPYVEAGVLIVSDGGAARGNQDQHRLNDTLLFLRTIRRFTPKVAWLNPVPLSRWTNTTAAAIRLKGRVPMFPFERAGLDAAVDILRGREH